jgi:hypothetical protein
MSAIPAPDDFVALVEVAASRIDDALEAANEMWAHRNDEAKSRQCYTDAKQNLVGGLEAGVRALGWP